MRNENEEEQAINEEEDEKSEDKEGKRKEKSYWKINVQQRPNSNKDSLFSSVSFVFNGVLQVVKKYLSAGVNLGPGTWIP